MLYQTGKTPNQIPFIIIGTELVLRTDALRFSRTFWPSGLIRTTATPLLFIGH